MMSISNVGLWNLSEQINQILRLFGGTFPKHMPNIIVGYYIDIGLSRYHSLNYLINVISSSVS